VLIRYSASSKLPYKAENFLNTEENILRKWSATLCSFDHE
jgi:hypothetical protein